jgi:CBS-domain-containing membrane protein
MPEESPIKDIIKVPLLAITVFVISLIGIYSKMPLLIPPFAASLFMIYLREGSEFAHFKNVLGGHLIGFACAFIGTLIGKYLTALPELITQSILIGIAILVAGLSMAIIRLEHPPAVATTLVFFGVKPEGTLIFNLIPVQSFISFLIGLAIVSIIAFLMYKKKGI